MGTKYDALAEELVLNMLHIHGHQFAMRATSSTNPNWDIVEFVKEPNGTYQPHYYQVKGHNWNNSSGSHTINANFPKLKNEGKVEYLFLVIFNHESESEPEIYRFKMDTEINEKGEGVPSELFDGKGGLLFSKDNPNRKDGKRTITLNAFYNGENEKAREDHRNKWK